MEETKKTRIVIVDDEPDLADIIVTFVTREFPDCEVLEFNNPHVALESLDYFDAMITDYQMPGMNGLELVAKFAEKTAYVPKIICLHSAYDLEELGDLKKLNVTYFKKPASMKKLLSTIRSGLDQMAGVHP